MTAFHKNGQNSSTESDNVRILSEIHALTGLTMPRDILHTFVLGLVLCQGCNLASLSDCETDSDCPDQQWCNPQGKFCELDQRPATIGLLIRDPRDAEQLQEAVDATTLAAEIINEAGGVLGRRLEVVPRFQEDIPGGFTEVEKQLHRQAVRELSAEGVIGIVGTQGSSSTLEVADEAFPLQTVVVAPSATTPELSSSQPARDRYAFRTAVPVGLGEAAAAVRFTTDVLSCGRIVFVREGNMSAFGNGYDAEYTRLLAAAGQCLALRIVVPENTKPSYPDTIQRLIEEQPDCIVMLTSNRTGTQILFDYRERQAEFTGPPAFVGGSGFNATSFVEGGRYSVGEATPNAAEGVYITRGRVDETRQSARLVRDLFNTRFGHAVDRDLRFPGFYDSVMLLALGATAGGSLTDRVAIRDGIWSVTQRTADHALIQASEYERAARGLSTGQSIKYLGASGDLDFDDFGDAAGATAIWQLKQGAFVLTQAFSIQDSLDLNARPPGSCPEPPRFEAPVE
ncbi:MAG: ABC transporter substrate-binding protein [Myxococcota bacterium]